MAVASFENSKRLFDLSCWKRGVPHFWDYPYPVEQSVPHYNNYWYDMDGDVAAIPAYDLSYLLTKLPTHIIRTEGRFFLCITSDVAGKWKASYRLGRDNSLDWHDFVQEADNPTEAVCMLAIRTFEAGMLKRRITSEKKSR